MPKGVYAHKPHYAQRRNAQSGPTSHPTLRDIAWAAGFLEGEGSFTRSGDRPGNAGCARIQCRQVEREPLDKLKALFGGTICLVQPQTNALSKKAIWDWNLSGARGRGVMMTLYPLLSTRRKTQVRAVLTHSPQRS